MTIVLILRCWQSAPCWTEAWTAVFFPQPHEGRIKKAQIQRAAGESRSFPPPYLCYQQSWCKRCLSPAERSVHPDVRGAPGWRRWLRLQASGSDACLPQLADVHGLMSGHRSRTRKYSNAKIKRKRLWENRPRVCLFGLLQRLKRIILKYWNASVCWC